MPLNAFIAKLEDWAEKAAEKGDFSSAERLSGRVIEAYRCEPEPLLSVSEAAELLGITTQTLGNWCREGKVECVALNVDKHTAGLINRQRAGNAKRGEKVPRLKVEFRFTHEQIQKMLKNRTLTIAKAWR